MEYTSLSNHARNAGILFGAQASAGSPFGQPEWGARPTCSDLRVLNQRESFRTHPNFPEPLIAPRV